MFDKKLNLKSHIVYVPKGFKFNAGNVQNELGADLEVLLRLYRSLLRSRLDYGALVYGSAQPLYLERLKPMQNQAEAQAKSICLGAFRTSPITSLHVEANEMPMPIRHQFLSLHFALRVYANVANPANQCIFNHYNARFYINGSKRETMQSGFNRLLIQVRLPDSASIFSAELLAIYEVLTLLECAASYEQILIVTDSLSSLQALGNFNITHPYVFKILEKYTILYNRGFDLVMLWCPSHVGVVGNARADLLAKKALSFTACNVRIPASDFKSVAYSFYRDKRAGALDRVWSRTISFTLFSLLLKNLQTVQERIDNYFDVLSMKQLFEEVAPSKILAFLKAILSGLNR
ncbi:hypothetical protein CAPTEDRAFT_215477 [Capitella teleta]|uniref:RNase H type-1 domain-containing protein n=1 Tax=Capitella teleta TaxID=283909 RepID=R7TYY0_CAPTE|nr:hypothetical protein CAPTEDRAFT_215477 [Capitella teleta]|eukprot:ELT99143.1 hypothetical protein CAPTEDRAFT_215477 [Capitella teleta]